MIDFDRLEMDFIKAKDVLLRKGFRESKITVFMTRAALEEFKKETGVQLNPHKSYILELFGHPVKIAEGYEQRVYIGVELKGVNDGKALDRE